MTDFTKQYCDIILKKIVAKIAKDEQMKQRAEIRRTENSLDGKSVRTQRHWKAAANAEFYYAEMVEGYKRMAELDRLTHWSSKLNQDRFKFMEKYPNIFQIYDLFYKEWEK